jgi:hypothetical protein
LSGIGKEKAEKLEERKKAKRLKEAFPETFIPTGTIFASHAR